MSLQEKKQLIKNKLSGKYDAIELNSLLSMLIEHVTGWNQLQQVIHKDELLSEEQSISLDCYTQELLSGKPIQYILEKAWFMGNDFFVNESVLIPRPETEELAEWIIEYARIVNKPLSIIDIGTGSGCIAITLKNNLSHCQVTGLDISNHAITIAKKNAAKLNATIEWIESDILEIDNLPKTYDIIVSNPPYIPFREKPFMQEQVKNFEPAIALFVHDDNPLIFYQSIAQLGLQSLSKNGQIFFEIHYDQSKAILSLLNEMGYHAECRKDMFGKNRMIRASLKN